MSRLEQFIRDHREEFDGDEPNPQVWKKLEAKLNPRQSGGRLVRMNILRWSAAAAVLVVVAISVLYFFKGPAEVAAIVSKDSSNDIMEEINPDYAKEVYHFTQLIEIKQSELKKIEKDQPELYKEFLSDITTLDSSYNALKKQLPENPNREQLLEAMIENLRIQTDLLNKQLQIIKKIKQSKQVSDESNSKSI